MCGEVSNYSYIPSKLSTSDKMTKMTLETPAFYNIFLKGLFIYYKSRKVVKMVEREHSKQIRLFK